MMISLADAATRLKLSVRQVRYMVQKDELPAKKVAGVWMVDEADLRTGPAAERRTAERSAEVRQAVEDALAPRLRTGGYSVTSIRAFSEIVAIWQAAKAALPADHPALPALSTCAVAIAQGAHAFRGRAKAEAYELARTEAARALAWMHLEGPATSLPERLEQLVLPAIGGLVRHSESRSRG